MLLQSNWKREGDELWSEEKKEEEKKQDGQNWEITPRTTGFVPNYWECKPAEDLSTVHGLLSSDS